MRKPLQELALAARRLRLLFAYRRTALARPRAALRYLIRDREVTNLTYELDNLDEMVAYLASMLGLSEQEVSAYVQELDGDEELLSEVGARLAARPDRNPVPRFGRRIGWYVVARALKPELIVETGVHDGLGSTALLCALERNTWEGSEGRLIGFDRDPGSGWLVPPRLRDRYTLVIGDIRETLPQALEGRQVGLFLHDSLHTYEHERFEFDYALRHRAGRIALISDNAHVSSALSDVCRESGMRYGFFREQPRDHFYPGAGIGLGLD